MHWSLVAIQLVLAIHSSPVFAQPAPQCKMAQDLNNRVLRLPIGHCFTRTNAVGSELFYCDGAGKTLYRKYFPASSSCAGNIAPQNVTTNYSFSCTGADCTLSGREFQSSTCSGTPNGSYVGLVDSSDCEPWSQSSSVKRYCNATVNQIYYYGVSDGTCSNSQHSRDAFIATYPYAGCTRRQNGKYLQIQNCTAPHNAAVPVLTFANSLTMHLYESGGGVCNSSKLNVVQQRRIGLCSLGNEEFCRNGDSVWRYEYNTSSTDCRTASQLNFVYFYKVNRCFPSFVIRGFLDALSSTQSVSWSCSGTTAPPVVDFGTNQFAYFEVFSDRRCSSKIYAGYGRADGTCFGSSPTTDVTCLADGGALIKQYPSSTCTGTPSLNMHLNSSCTLLPHSDRNHHMPIYVKVFGCGLLGNTIDPKDVLINNGSILNGSVVRTTASPPRTTSGVLKIDVWVSVVAMLCVVSWHI